MSEEQKPGSMGTEQNMTTKQTGAPPGSQSVLLSELRPLPVTPRLSTGAKFCYLTDSLTAVSWTGKQAICCEDPGVFALYILMEKLTGLV